MTQDRPKPASFGFDADFSDLSTVQPTTRAAAAQPLAAKKAPSKPKKTAAKTRPKSKAASKPAVLKEREQMADKLAKSMGFESREQKNLVLKKRRRTHHDEPVDQLSIRGPVRVLNEFITFCETNHLSYWEAMEQLLEMKSSNLASR